MYTGSIPVLASKGADATESLDNKGKSREATEQWATHQTMYTDSEVKPMLINNALTQYKTEHLDTIKTGAERFTQLSRVLSGRMSDHMSSITTADMSAMLSRWSGATRNRYRSALTHFWKYGRSLGWTDLHPTLMGGKEQPRDNVLTIAQLRALYEAAPYQGQAWAQYGRLLILTGQRHSDLMRFCPSRLRGQDMHLPTSKNGMPHIVPLGPKGFVLGGLMPNQFATKATTAHFKRRWFRSAFIPLSFRLQDIRRSMATHLCEAGENEADVDRLLNHVASATARGVARTYNRAQRLSQRREIVQQWEAMLFG